MYENVQDSVAARLDNRKRKSAQPVHLLSTDNHEKSKAKISKNKKKFVPDVPTEFETDVPTESETNVPVAQVFHI